MYSRAILRARAPQLLAKSGLANRSGQTAKQCFSDVAVEKAPDGEAVCGGAPRPEPVEPIHGIQPEVERRH